MPPEFPAPASTYDTEVAIPSGTVAGLMGTCWASLPGRRRADIARFTVWLRYDAKHLQPDEMMRQAATILAGQFGEITPEDAAAFWRTLWPEVPSFAKPEDALSWLWRFREAAVVSRIGSPTANYFTVSP